jgi:hypothetical protein
LDVCLGFGNRGTWNDHFTTGLVGSMVGHIPHNGNAGELENGESED